MLINVVLMRIQGPSFYLMLGKHKISYWLNGVCGREGMKTLRYIKKIYLQKMIFFLAGISASLHSKSIPVTRIKTPCCQNKAASMDREVLCHSWSPACRVHPTVPEPLQCSCFRGWGNPECHTQSCAVQAQNWEPASPSWRSTALKTDSKYWNLTFSCSAPLWVWKDRGLQEIQWRLFLGEKCKFIAWPVPSETNFKSFGTN